MRIFERLKAASDRAALALAALYGSALTIWAFTAYSLLGAVVTPDARDVLLYWGSAAQLVYCPLAVYVAKLVLDRQKTTHAKVDDLHGKFHDLHQKVTDIHTQITDDSTGGM